MSIVHRLIELCSQMRMMVAHHVQGHSSSGILQSEVLTGLSTEEILQKISEAGIEVTDVEAQRFRDNDVDGETVDCGLTETMVAYLFQGSFKKQAKFNQFVCKLKETVVTLTLEPVPPEECQQSCSTIPRNGANVRMPASFDIPAFPRHLQAKLDNKEPCQKNPKDRHIMIRVLYEAVAQYTMYPTTSEYVQVVKMLIVKYPFLKDLEGNGYAPSVLGEDPSSIETHVNVLHSQYQKMQPDFRIVQDRMQQTFAWRQKEIADGMTVEDTVKKYPFLRTPTGLCDELERIHPATGNLCKRFSEGFKCIVPKVLHLAQRKCPLFKFYLETKEEALTEDLPDIDFRAALIFLPYIFKENIDRFITLGETDLDSPYPTPWPGELQTF
ncbi:uncharacterized protein LOC131537553 isoform X2 [Onychostoma macrolepis]|uniref:uncharacterized protein LOC131537553 isoform X2 n=1 Tax=Onychostoma macrolepis TaxID=369639 RepID=UPI00272A9D74|nr:uncharacterized protein LOC131537553 isoform X2 [Onychostoma macrolepis]